MTKETKPQTTPSNKTCTQCGETKSTEEFHKNKAKKDGLGSYCKPCQREQNRKYRAANLEQERERCLEKNRRWRAENPDKVRASSQRQLAKHYRNVARVRKLMEHFEGRVGWLENLAAVVARRSGARNLCYLAGDIEELLTIHRYKEI